MSPTAPVAANEAAAEGVLLTFVQVLADISYLFIGVCHTLINGCSTVTIKYVWQ